MANRADLRPEALARTWTLVIKAVPDALATGYEDLVAAVELPDPDDRHVVAAAIRAGAQVIVTANLTDFPDSALAKYRVEAQQPDEFVGHLLDLAPGVESTVVREQAAALRSPPRTIDDVLDLLITNGLAQSVARLRELCGA